MTDPHPKLSVEYFLKTRLPYNAVQTCPVCRNTECTPQYTEHQTIRRSATTWESAVTFGGDTDPHVVVQCDTCNFYWEMEVAHP